ncbi:MAG: ABC transporter permease [Oscillospiraceae bacterium]|nr:ABC transporter permease [Oscillospiraceae bacterium]
MNRVLAFTERNIKEMLRDVLSYIFCLGFPIVMLVVMTLVNESLPAEAGMTIFRIDNLAGGIAVFGQTFVMLFTALSVSKDRSGAFLTRMYASPMRSSDFVLGYILPMLVIAVVQCLITYAASLIISLISDVELSIPGLLVSVVTLIPSAVMFIGLGLLFGTLFSEKAAPGLCSIVISLGSFLGGIWFDAEATGGVMLKLCKVLPFWYCTKTARSSMALEFGFDEFVMPLIIVTIIAAAVAVISAAVFRMKMRADLR